MVFYHNCKRGIYTFLNKNGETQVCRKGKVLRKNGVLSTSSGEETLLNDKVILTADSTLMSDYRSNEFLGFGTCAPPNFIPDFLFKWLFFPPIKTEKDSPVAAPYGLRKIEAQLLREGFNVSTVMPNHLKKHVADAKVLGIHVMDPFGLGPASSTFAAILRKEPFLALYFRALLGSREVKEAKKHGLKIVVGGPGVWQFRYRQKFVEKYGIDCIIEGEAERVVGKVFRAAINGEEIPKHYETKIDETPSLEEIPNIVGPSVNGLVEIGRGCCRGCKFCSVTLRPLRWYPYEKIFDEIEVNMKIGNLKGAILHAEDVMLYGSKNTLPDDERLVELHEMVMKKCDGITWSHCSIAAIASKPKLFEKVAEIIHQKQPWWGVEIGLETGSPELAEKIMPGKAHPFKAKDWPEVVRVGMGLMHDNGLVPAATLIVGAPEEREEDVLKTLEMLDDLREFRSLIVPLFFVPLGRLKDEDWFKETQLTKLHEELLIKCFEHGYHWVDDVIDLSFLRLQGSFLKLFYKSFTSILRFKARQFGIHINP
jgi:radical SAM superfamily enzyme YgiQ (UPF0313 family)